MNIIIFSIGIALLIIIILLLISNLKIKREKKQLIATLAQKETELIRFTNYLDSLRTDYPQQNNNENDDALE